MSFSFFLFFFFSLFFFFFLLSLYLFFKFLCSFFLFDFLDVLKYSIFFCLFFILLLFGDVFSKVCCIFGVFFSFLFFFIFLRLSFFPHFLSLHQLLSLIVQCLTFRFKITPCICLKKQQVTAQEITIYVI